MAGVQRSDEDLIKLLKTLGVENDTEFKLAMLEVVGMLVLCVHWLRGTFNWMKHTGALRFSSKKEEENYERLFNDVALYESFIWEIVPPRALLLVLRELRQTGSLREGHEVLSNQDPHGRIPFDLSKETLDDIEDLMRRLGEARAARSKIEDAQLRDSDAGKGR